MEVVVGLLLIDPTRLYFSGALLGVSVVRNVGQGKLVPHLVFVSPHEQHSVFACLLVFYATSASLKRSSVFFQATGSQLGRIAGFPPHKLAYVAMVTYLQH